MSELGQEVSNRLAKEYLLGNHYNSGIRNDLIAKRPQHKSGYLDWRRSNE